MERITDIIGRRLRGALSAEEQGILDKWLEESPDHRRLLEEMEDPADLAVRLQKMDAYSGQAIWAKVKPAAASPVAHPVRSLRTSWLRYAAILLIVFTGAVTYFYLRTLPHYELIQHKSPLQTSAIAPGGNKAILTLADGSTILLDSAANGPLALQGNTQLLKMDGDLLSYRPGKTAGEALFNTIRTPRGGKYQLVLPDGTRVWLNAASSLRYPIAFTGAERRVEMTGEVYFEVAADHTTPFTVQADNRSAVEVLGTRFNINSYANEGRVAATLLEGSVRVRTLQSTSRGLVLKPGQQAQVGADVVIIDDVKTDEVMAWKNGVFNFENASLGQVMRQLERWYDIDIVYEKGIPEIYFGGEMSRSVPLSEVLAGLADARVHFRMEGRKLVVMP